MLHFGVQFMFDQAQILDSSQQWGQADLDVLLGAGEDEAGALSAELPSLVALPLTGRR